MRRRQTTSSHRRPRPVPQCPMPGHAGRRSRPPSHRGGPPTLALDRLWPRSAAPTAPHDESAQRPGLASQRTFSAPASAPATVNQDLNVPLSWWSGAGSNRRPSAFQAHPLRRCRWLGEGLRSDLAAETMARRRLVWPGACRRWLPVWLPKLISAANVRRLGGLTDRRYQGDQARTPWSKPTRRPHTLRADSSSEVASLAPTCSTGESAPARGPRLDCCNNPHRHAWSSRPLVADDSTFFGRMPMHVRAYLNHHDGRSRVSLPVSRRASLSRVAMTFC